jgi:RNA polymerase sigma factor (sigma-70 family)
MACPLLLPFLMINATLLSGSETQTTLETRDAAEDSASNSLAADSSGTETRAQSALARLYDLYFPLVHRICYRYTKNGEEANDLAQEVFLKVHASYRGFEGNSQPSTWLYRVAVNHCLDYIRWKKRQADLMAGYADDLARRQPQESSADHPAKRLLRRLLDGLDEANRQVVFLRFEVGLTHEEIAEICGVSRVAVTKRLAKFQTKLVTLKDELVDSMEEGGYETAAPVTCNDAGDDA